MTGCNHQTDWMGEMDHLASNPLEVLEGSRTNRNRRVAWRGSKTWVQDCKVLGLQGLLATSS